jgi:hypothetical protein
VAHTSIIMGDYDRRDDRGGDRGGDRRSTYGHAIYFRSFLLSCATDAMQMPPHLSARAFVFHAYVCGCCVALSSLLSCTSTPTPHHIAAQSTHSLLMASRSSSARTTQSCQAEWLVTPHAPFLLTRTGSQPTPNTWPGTLFGNRRANTHPTPLTLLHCRGAKVWVGCGKLGVDGGLGEEELRVRLAAAPRARPIAILSAVIVVPSSSNRPSTNLCCIRPACPRPPHPLHPPHPHPLTYLLGHAITHRDLFSLSHSHKGEG